MPDTGVETCRFNHTRLDKFLNMKQDLFPKTTDTDILQIKTRNTSVGLTPKFRINP